MVPPIWMSTSKCSWYQSVPWTPSKFASWSVWQTTTFFLYSSARPSRTFLTVLARAVSSAECPPRMAFTSSAMLPAMSAFWRLSTVSRARLSDGGLKSPSSKQLKYCQRDVEKTIERDSLSAAVVSADADARAIAQSRETVDFALVNCCTSHESLNGLLDSAGLSIAVGDVHRA